MPNVPSDRRQLIEWVRARLATWSENQAVIGITQAQLTAVENSVTSASNAFSEAEAARAASKGATESYYAASSSLRNTAGDVVRSIQTLARNTGNAAIYGLADIEAPQPRSRNAPPPGQPFELRAEINSDGSLTLRWKNSNPQGVSNVVYQIRRALNNSTNFVLFDTVGERSFTDTSFPGGTNSVSYIVTGKRGNQTGQPSSVFTARFGVGGVGGAGQLSIESTSTGEPTGIKLAA